VSGVLNGLYLPAEHAEQLPPVAPDVPASQVQSDCSSLPASALELDGHPRQVVSERAPSSEEYFPMSQDLHLYFPDVIFSDE
jgi:hypothetical protein